VERASAGDIDPRHGCMSTGCSDCIAKAGMPPCCRSFRTAVQIWMMQIRRNCACLTSRWNCHDPGQRMAPARVGSWFKSLVCSSRSISLRSVNILDLTNERSSGCSNIVPASEHFFDARFDVSLVHSVRILCFPTDIRCMHGGQYTFYNPSSVGSWPKNMKPFALAPAKARENIPVSLRNRSLPCLY
jgi:hypothetical protein